MKKREHFVTCGQMKILEKRADEAGLSYYQMMENAGSRAADCIMNRVSYREIVREETGSRDGTEHFHVAEASERNISLDNDVRPGRAIEIPIKSPNNNGIVFLFCGKGNNGGDGFVVARLLCQAGFKVTVILVDGEPKTSDSITNLGLLKELPVKILDMHANDRALMELKEVPDVVVDAIYGTGFYGKLSGNALKAAIYINRFSKSGAVTANKETLVFALDIPSGMGGDLTSEKKLDTSSVTAHYTIAFHARKPVHLQNFAKPYLGEVMVVDIGINEEELWHVEL